MFNQVLVLTTVKSIKGECCYCWKLPFKITHSWSSLALSIYFYNVSLWDFNRKIKWSLLKQSYGSARMSTEFNQETKIKQTNKKNQTSKQKSTKLLVQVATNLNLDYGSLKIQIRWKFLCNGVFNYDTDPPMSYDSGVLYRGLTWICPFFCPIRFNSSQFYL